MIQPSGEPIFLDSLEGPRQIGGGGLRTMGFEKHTPVLGDGQWKADAVISRSPPLETVCITAPGMSKEQCPGRKANK